MGCNPKSLTMIAKLELVVMKNTRHEVSEGKEEGVVVVAPGLGALT